MSSEPRNRFALLMKYFYLSLSRTNTNKFLSFSIVIVATGLWEPNIPPMVGIELADGYESVSLNLDEFENKSVLILGTCFYGSFFKGNSVRV